jgi:2-C-methyl-D-erythritol 2,4-cyclodiphosphate synthase
MSDFDRLRIGLGMDSHRIASGGPMILGGISLDVDMHFVGHSDADVLLHAITDAILSAAGLPDIGEMLAIAMGRVRSLSWTIVNLDCVIQLERPKLSGHKTAMKSRIADLLQITPEQVSLKGKTGEGIGEIGRGELCEATCIVLLKG